MVDTVGTVMRGFMLNPASRRHGDEVAVLSCAPDESGFWATHSPIMDIKKLFRYS